MPATAIQHFREDISRASAIVAHARALPTGTEAERLLRSDILRSGWMFAVGAMDAYFCDAYTDVIAASLIAKSRQQNISLPNFFYNIVLPVRAILEPYDSNDNWRWRMAARKMMTRENVLSLETIRKLFNPFFRDGHKFFRELIDDWAVSSRATARVFGVRRTDYAALHGAARDNQRKLSWKCMQKRFGKLAQRRHDCIHNCDRPAVRPQCLDRPGTVGNVIRDVSFLVKQSETHIRGEFRVFLQGTGCSVATIAQAGY